MAELTGQQILESAGVETKLVDVSKWIPDGEIRIRVMSGEQHDAYEKSLLKITVKGNKVTQEPDISNRTAKLLARCICDAEGRSLFSEKQIDELGKKNGPMLRHLAKEATELNGLDKSVEDLAKNLSTSPESDSSTDSQ